MPSATNKRNKRLGEEWVEDPAVRAALQNINRRFQEIEKLLEFPRRRITDPCPSFTTTAGSSVYEKVPGLDLSVPTRGGSVFIGLQFAPGSILKSFLVSNAAGAVAQVAYRFVRDGFELPGGLLQVQATGATAVILSTPPTIWFLDENLSAGNHNYRFEVITINANHQFTIAGAQLVGIELR